MSDLISKAISNFQDKITEYYLPIINPNSFESREPNKKVQLNKTSKSKSQHIMQKIIATSSNHSPPNTGTTQQYSFGQSNQPKDNDSIQPSSLMNKTIDQKESQNDMININQLIQQKKKELNAEKNYFLKEITRIRQNFEMKAKIRNKFQKERKSTTSSQDKYEKCWDETLKEINKDSKEFYQLIEQSNQDKQQQFKRIQKSKPLRSQIFSKIREQENQYFKQRSGSIIKLMKQRQIQVVDEVSAQIEQVQLLKKEQQYQRSKEREEGKQEIIKSLKFKEQGKLLKLLQNKSSNRHLQLSRKSIEKSDDVTNSFSKRNKIRSISFNCALPTIDLKQDEGLIQMIVQQQNQINQKFIDKPQFNRKNLIGNQINGNPYSDLSKLIRYS
ncbi:unnamed protein product [Paramecium pentaurelia]|uniref:Uncharacterized protein n=1 Tax=Paramecium pentaurelia TaxID=43138 RepID=A0A8S1SLV3_9CILI|nr:unnamed protein product [Paramecium pentaurelia]